MGGLSLLMLVLNSVHFHHIRIVHLYPHFENYDKNTSMKGWEENTIAQCQGTLSLGSVLSEISFLSKVCWIFQVFLHDTSYVKV